MKKIEVWAWSKGGPVPEVEEGGLVVCEPGLADGSGTEAQITAARLVEAYLAERPSVRLAMSSADPQEAFERFGDVLIAPRTIPALHVTRQADLARLPGLLAVKAERRALVVTPWEAIDLSRALAIPGVTIQSEDPHAAFLMFDQGAKAPETISYPRAVDVVFIVGGNAPLHPDWVRSIVEQCRAAGVPVVFMSWGAWLPQSQGSGPFQPTSYVFLNRDGRIDKKGHAIVTNMGWVGVGRVDGEHSGHVVDNRIIRGAGALLDGNPIEDVPTWVGGVA